MLGWFVWQVLMMVAQMLDFILQCFLLFISLYGAFICGLAAHWLAYDLTIGQHWLVRLGAFMLYPFMVLSVILVVIA